MKWTRGSRTVRLPLVVSTKETEAKAPEQNVL